MRREVVCAGAYALVLVNTEYLEKYFANENRYIDFPHIHTTMFLQATPLPHTWQQAYSTHFNLFCFRGFPALVGCT